MKTRFSLSILFLITLLLFAFKPKTKLDPQYSQAKVSVIEGVYVFTDALPTTAYTELGQVEVYFAGDTQYDSIRNKLIRKAKKMFPTTQEVIIRCNKKSIDQSTAIVF